MDVFRVSNLLATLFCIVTVPAAMSQAPQDWFLFDPSTSDFNGIALYRLQATLDETMPAHEVVVAIIDSGIDTEHEDLRGRIWVNIDEIPGNGKDDDNNGYIDDIHGWNFIGSKDGQNIVHETLEVTRLYAKYREYFTGKISDKLSKKDRRLYEKYLEYKKIVERERKNTETQIEQFASSERFILDGLSAFDIAYPDQKLDPEFLRSFDPGDQPQLQIAKQIFDQALQFGAEFESTDELRTAVNESFIEAKEGIEYKLTHWYNPDFDARKIIGDNYSDATERNYGNNDTNGGDAFHGTHVAGLVGARSDNTDGGQGVFQRVKLMSVRVVPDGDERDKDVANAIFYAVDNGASIINMSFGKGYSWNKKIVDKAVKYARKHDVLLVHAAGNSATNNDESPHYPTRTFKKKGLFGKKQADNWISVGALNWEKGLHAIASFSQYGKKSVDLFAPGVQMFSTTPNNLYQAANGTSSAAPVVSGVAALIRSYFPTLTAQQVREVLIKSVTPLKGKVIKPGTDERVDASELSISGGGVNVYQAYRLAARMKGKKKIKPPRTTQHRA